VEIQARLGDTLVMRADHWPVDDRVSLAKQMIDVNAELWSWQTGTCLLTSRDRGVLLPGRDETMLEAAVNEWQRRAASGLLASTLDRRLLTLVGTESGELDALVESCERLNRKNTSIKILEAAHVPIPLTIIVDGSSEVLDELSEEIRYVLKAEGSSGGVGVYLNGQRGYDRASLKRLISEFAQQGRLPARFQIQEFVEGRSMGATAVFDHEGGFRVASIHRQDVRDAAFDSGHWRRPEQDTLEAFVGEVYARLACVAGLRLLGPVGIDFQMSESRAVVLEINARLTACTPFAWLRERLAHVDIQAMDLLTDIRLSLADLTNPQFSAVIRNVISQVDGEWRLMLLPQGLDPFHANRILFVNDERNELKRAFFEAFPNARTSEDREQGGKCRINQIR
jgi:hypothetical protein